MAVGGPEWIPLFLVNDKVSVQLELEDCSPFAIRIGAPDRVFLLRVEVEFVEN
jgi:hypothetical protein